MHWIDWTVLASVLLFIIAYGIYKTRNIKTADGFLAGDRQTPWWMVGLSVMATQASAITFLSTPGQAFDDGMRFVQFYFGLPLAMVLLSIFVLPLYFKLKVYTAYEYLESRFDLKTRTLTAIIFLIQRGLAAGITIYAPAIILSTILDINLMFTNILIGIMVIAYTLAGGTQAVSQTQKQQMIVIMTGMVIAFITIVKGFPSNVSFSDALHLSGGMGKLNMVTFDFDLSDRYNIWSAMLGGTFLFLAYFGTDQSQVQRYISAKSLKESRMGLMFNALFKVPMQFFILLTGVMVFVFFQFHKSPIHFNPNTNAVIEKSANKADFEKANEDYNLVFDEKMNAIEQWKQARVDKNELLETTYMSEIVSLEQKEKEIRTGVKNQLKDYNSTLPKSEQIEVNDKDYVFIYYILNFLPIGLIGLLIAVIFSASMSSTAAELNALATTSVVDIYKRSFAPNISDKQYLRASKMFTLLWGVLAILFAISASLFENLIQAVNILGSIFYGTVLGIFVVAFFIKAVKSKAVFIAALIVQIAVIVIFYLDHIGTIKIAYLWLNAIGCLGVMFLSLVLEKLLPAKGM
ncbi:MAG: sodium:solute symporter [Bacteroidetes bacterium]|nr:sodium:solute symporter [Bacteroidota bacterium]